MVRFAHLAYGSDSQPFLAHEITLQGNVRWTTLLC